MNIAQYYYNKYGAEPYNIFLVHGGPGAVGDLKPLCEHLSEYCGVVETLHKGLTISFQLDELFQTIVENKCEKATLVGHSWGAWLVYMFAAKYPELVKKIVLVGSGPFEASYSEGIMGTRFQRLSEPDRKTMVDITSKLDSPLDQPSSTLLEELRRLLIEADSFNLDDEYLNHCIKINYDVYRNVWFKAERLRKEGTLLEMAEQIRCPVTAIHGDYDPHPYIGVEMPLSDVLSNFNFEMLEKCGHYPWFEKHAKDRFYKILLKEIL